MPRVYVALLRGINLGGHNKVPMKDLAAMFSDCGCVQVRTFIQSGNVIFQAPAGSVAKIPARISALIAERLGHKVPVVLRTLDQMAAVVAKNPFLLAGVPEDQLHVSFLAAAPSQERVASLDPQRSPPDEFQVIGADIYLRLLNPVSKNKLTNAYFDSKLATVSTQRNWRTVTKLLQLMQPSA